MSKLKSTESGRCTGSTSNGRRVAVGRKRSTDARTKQVTFRLDLDAAVDDDDDDEESPKSMTGIRFRAAAESTANLEATTTTPTDSNGSSASSTSVDSGRGQSEEEELREATCDHRPTSSTSYRRSSRRDDFFCDDVVDRSRRDVIDAAHRQPPLDDDDRQAQPIVEISSIGGRTSRHATSSAARSQIVLPSASDQTTTTTTTRGNPPASPITLPTERGGHFSKALPPHTAGLNLPSIDARRLPDRRRDGVDHFRSSAVRTDSPSRRRRSRPDQRRPPLESRTDRDEPVPDISPSSFRSAADAAEEQSCRHVREDEIPRDADVASPSVHADHRHRPRLRNDGVSLDVLDSATSTNDDDPVYDPNRRKADASSATAPPEVDRYVATADRRGSRIAAVHATFV